MFARIFNRFGAFIVFFFSCIPLWAAEEEKATESPVWVLSYAIMIAFLALTLFILLRPTKRSDSAFSYDEQKAIKEEEIKKIKGTH